MDILHSISALNSNKCISTNNSSLILNDDNTLLESIIFLKLGRMYGGNCITSQPPSNVLYFIAEKYQYHNINDYLMYLELDGFDCDVKLSKYLIYLLNFRTNIKNAYMPHIVYLYLNVGSSIEWVNTYKNLQYFAFIGTDYYPRYIDNIIIDQSYLIVARFMESVKLFTTNSRYLLAIIDKNYVEDINCGLKHIIYTTETIMRGSRIISYIIEY
jgi:hypothetical protein